MSPSGVNLLSSGKIEGFGTVQGTYQGETGGLLWVKGGDDGRWARRRWTTPLHMLATSRSI